MPSPADAVNLDGGGAVLRKEVRSAQVKPTAADKPFAILRYAKLKSANSIRGSAMHMRRDYPTPNADPARTNSNIVLVGTPDPAEDVLKLLPPVGSRDAAGKLRRRSNSVLSVEVLITTSPRWWDTATPEQQDDWIARSRAWLEAEWGAENIAHLELHRDEKTPHLTGLIVPLDEAGHLNARAQIGGKASKRKPGSSLISGHQSRYAEAVEPLGLRRGILGSTARHTTVQEYYKALEAAEKPRPIKIETPPVLGRAAWSEEVSAIVNARSASLAAQAVELPFERRKRRAAEKTAEANASALEEARASRRALADEMRALPLEDVIAALGLDEDPAERGMWKAGPKGERTHRISIKDSKWFDHVAQRGRGGAIDLAQHVLGTDFNGSLAWLADRFGSAATTAEYRRTMHDAAAKRVEKVVQERKPFTLPEPDPDAWSRVRQHLIEDRALPADLIDAAHEAGDVYAVSRKLRGTLTLRNAVFVQRDADGTPTGAELKGIVRGVNGAHWSGLAPGSSKARGVFRVGAGLAQAARVFVVESAIDAMSLAARVRNRVKSFVILSTAGDNTMPEPILAGLHPEAKRFAAQDRNLAGDRQAERLGDGWTRTRPAEPFEDWNEELVARRDQNRSDSAAADLQKPTSEPSLPEPPF